MIRPESLSSEQVAEIQVFGWYCLEKRGDVRRSRLQPEHFTDPDLRRWWVAATEDPNGNYRDYGLTADQVADLTGLEWSVAGSQIPGLESKLVERFASKRLAYQAKRIAEDLAAKKIPLAEALRRYRELVGECQGGTLVEPKTFREAGVELMDQVFHARSRAEKGQLGMAIPMPLRRLQEAVGGWRVGKLWMALGATSHHKTTLARLAAQSAAKHFSDLGQGKALIWTMEDSVTDIVARGVAAEVEWLDTRMLHGLGQAQQPVALEAMVRDVGAVLDQDWATRLRLVARTRPTAQEVIGLISAEAARGTRFFVLDYLQLIRRDNPREDFHEFWRNVCNDLQALAKETDSVILATVQPTQSSSRDHFSSGIRLTKSDIWGGAGISQAAHGILTLNAVNRHRCRSHQGHSAGCDDCKWSAKNWERDPDAIRIVVDKNKDGPRVNGIFAVDAAHDLITDERTPE